MYNEYGLETTHNQFGFMHRLSPLGQAFIDYSTQRVMDKPLLDIGSAFGVNSIPCLTNNAQVVACDIENSHLHELIKRTPEQYRSNLTTQLGRFPEQLEFENNAFSGAIISHVLSFLTEQELEVGFEKFSRWICPGGKLFILNYTPFHKTLANFIPDYHKQLKQRDIFAGFIDDKRRYSKHEIIHEDVPNELMLFDKNTISYLFNKFGFEVEQNEYIGGENIGVPAPFCMDGEEWVSAIGIKRS